MKKTVTASVTIKTYGPQGVGKSRLLDALLDSVTRHGGITSVQVDEEGHTAEVALKYTTEDPSGPAY